MNLLSTLCTMALFTTAIAPALAATPTTGALPTPANRIVGAWSNVAMVGPCNSAVRNPLRQTVVFHAGGTFLDNSRFPPGGVSNANGVPGLNQRSIGVGVWKYNPLTGQYSLTQQFDWFVDNVYHGYQVVERTILLSNNNNAAAGQVHTVRYAANGTVVSEQCGDATSTRL